LSNNALECSITIRVALAIKLAELGTDAQKSWLWQITATTFAELAATCKKIVHSHKPGKHGSAMTKLHNDAAWHCRVAEGKVVAARIAEPHHNDPIKVWNGKLQSLWAHCHESRKKFVENRGFDKTIGADGWPIDLRHPVYRYPWLRGARNS
jgi:hypothetical protein